MNQTKPVNPRQMAHLLQETMDDAYLVLRGSILSEEGSALLLDVSDPTGPNSTRTFLIKVEEV